MKIFITGFRHSGTSMLMQLIRAHPQVGWIEDEEGYIEYDKTKLWLNEMASKKVSNLGKFSWGEKLPWGTRAQDKGGKRIIRDIRKWLSFFGKKARVIQILRHPFDVSLSSYPLDITRSEIAEDQYSFYMSSVPKVIDFINKDRRCGVTVYEGLVMYPKESLKNIFDFLKLKSDEKTIKRVMNTDLKFGKINPERAFAHRKLNLKRKFDYDKLIWRIKNKI
jgi:hypothetical protein